MYYTNSNKKGLLPFYYFHSYFKFKLVLIWVSVYLNSFPTVLNLTGVSTLPFNVNVSVGLYSADTFGVNVKNGAVCWSLINKSSLASASGLTVNLSDTL